MRGLRYLVRFFHVAPPTPAATSAFVATTAAAVPIVFVAPERAPDALMPVLLLQLFTVSSGFLVPARRGHYDILLAMGHPRLAVAVVHWIGSAAAGLASCGSLIAADALAGGGQHARLRASGTLIAIVVASTIPWSINVRLPRYTSAIVWLLTLLTVRAALPSYQPGALTTSSLAAAAERAIAFVLYPPALVGRSLEGPDWLSAAIVVGVAAGAMVWALTTVHRSDVPLEAAQ